MASAVAQAINDPVLSIYLFDIERLFKREASGLLSARELVIVDPIVMGSARRAETASISAGVPALEDWTRKNSRPSGAGAASLAPLRAGHGHLHQTQSGFTFRAGASVLHRYLGDPNDLENSKDR